MNPAMNYPSALPADPIAASGEACLVRSLQDGDPRAYETLVREFGPRMLAVAQRMLHCPQDAADAVQDAFVSAFRAIGSFEGSSSLGTWLHRVTVNACLMLIRKQRRKGATSIEELLPQFDEKGHHAQPVARWGGALEQLETQETGARVRACIDLLPEAYRTVLVMRDLGEMDTQATATALNTTEGNVKTRLHRARQMLRTLLEKEVIGGGLSQL